jgi:hypothetical protein
VTVKDNHLRVTIGGFLDHWEELTIDGTLTRVVISQPYYYDHDWLMIPELKWWRKMDLTFRLGGKERSWYNPDETELVVVGLPADVERINLDYAVPNPAGRFTRVP